MESEGLAQTDGRGSRSQVVYDAQGRVAKTIDALGHETTYGYDALGRQISVIDPLTNIVSSNRYDAAGRLAASTTYAATSPQSILRASASLRETNGQSYPIRSAIYRYDTLGERTLVVGKKGQTLLYKLYCICLTVGCGIW